MTCGSLFSGIGGIDLGLSRAGVDIKWMCEIDPFCQRVLKKNFPGVRIYGDIASVDGNELEPVDLIAGGFPCQDISYAGKGAGIDGDRSGLWSEMLRIVRLVRPRFVLVENVPALLARGMGRVLGDLAESGYDAEWQCLPAAAFGAPHLRDRAFIVAYTKDSIGAGVWTEQGRKQSGPANNGWWTVEPRLDRVADGVPARVDRIRGLGNAVVPQVAQWLGERILEAEAARPRDANRYREGSNDDSLGAYRR